MARRKESAPKSDREAKRQAMRDKAEGKRATTQASHFVHEEMEAYKGKKKSSRRPKNRKQAIAIGLSKARRSGIKLPPRRAA